MVSNVAWVEMQSGFAKVRQMLLAQFWLYIKGLTIGKLGAAKCGALSYQRTAKEQLKI